MRFPLIEGVIRRRILVNWRVDPEVLRARLPEPFRPKLHGEHGIAGVCLIRLESLRPPFLPAAMGLASENAAHRVAVRWPAQESTAEGVYIPRRDTDSRLTRLAGGRLFPGEHHGARFQIHESAERVELRMDSDDGELSVGVRGRVAGELPASSCFANLAQASAFFESGSIGWSATRSGDRLDGLELRTHGWSVEPLELEDAWSSYFDDRRLFPKGSAQLDCALLMRNLRHEWRPVRPL